jgi:predicted secreted Zn-dependent protease
VDSSLVAEWDRYRAALAVHERGHRLITYAGAGRVIRAIRDVPAQSCAFIRDAVQRTVEPLLTEIRSEDAQYDTETRHGATQGAIWRLTLPQARPRVPAARP